MKVTIAIPSCSSDRIPMLIRTVESIQVGSYKDVHIVVVADGNPEIFAEVQKKKFNELSIILNNKRMDWVFSVNRVWKEFPSDYYIYAADDLIFPPDCIKCAVATMQKCFPDGFGLITLSRRKKAIFGLFGNKWANHFPERQVLCPDFIHYGADREITEVANELGVYDCLSKKKNRVKHFIIKNDETWKLVKKIITKDPIMRQKRREKGYKWGVDFNLITR